MNQWEQDVLELGAEVAWFIRVENKLSGNVDLGGFLQYYLDKDVR